MTKDIDLAKFLTQERHDIHLVGVAGSGMSGIAGLLLQLGHQVSGSDKSDSLETDRLQRLGLKFYQEHRAADARDAELVVYSSAIKKDNPILKSAQENGKRTVRRAEALAAIMAAKRGILVVGMHGKTTTSAMSPTQLAYVDLPIALFAMVYRTKPITAAPTWSCATLARCLAFTAAKKNSAKLFSMFPANTTLGTRLASSR